MIQLTPTAVSEVQRLRARWRNPQLRLRLGVQSSHCLDMAYTMSFDDSLQMDDQVEDCNGIQVVVSPDSIKWLDGLVIDYSEDLMGGGFRFHNPNAAQSCGCGNSFKVAPTP